MQPKKMQFWEIEKGITTQVSMLIHRSYKHFSQERKKGLKDSYVFLSLGVALLDFLLLIPTRALLFMLRTGALGPIEPMKTTIGIIILLILIIIPFILAKLPPYRITAEKGRLIYKGTTFLAEDIEKIILEKTVLSNFQQAGLLRVSGRIFGQRLILKLKNGQEKYLELFHQSETTDLKPAIDLLAQTAGIAHETEELN